MNKLTAKVVLVVLVLATSGIARADFGIGMKAGTLGLGIEGRWSPLPWLDLRAGANRYDYIATGTRKSIAYDSTLSLDTYFATGSLRFPLSPFRITAGIFSNGNHLQLVSQDTITQDLTIAGIRFATHDIGKVHSTTSFEKNAPYAGIGFDFELLNKVGLNLDLGMLWQGDPTVTLEATEMDTAPLFVQSMLEPALETERLALESEISDYKAWPVVSLSFVYNF